MKKSFTEIINCAFHAKCIEPNQRFVGGQFGWARHRFPIKNGISYIDVANKNISRTSSLFQRFVAKRAD